MTETIKDVDSLLRPIVGLSIDDSRKSSAMRTLVTENILVESDVIQFLIRQQCTNILEIFLSADHAAKRRYIPVSSGSGWTDAELSYYNVVFEDVRAEDIVNTTVVLSDKAANFVESNRDFTLAKLADKKGIEQVKLATTEFQRCIILVINNPSMESCVDNMFQKFMESVMDTEEFLITQRYDMDFYISNVRRKATADIVAILFYKLYVGVIVVEDKSTDSSRTSSQCDNAEAQLTAEAIAIAQQDRWPVDTPIFMFRVMGVFVSVYKAKFTREFVTSVKTGTRRALPLSVLRYSPKDPVFSGNTPGCNLLYPADRELLVMMLNSMSIEIKGYFIN
jgi:hypothetical protein